MNFLIVNGRRECSGGDLPVVETSSVRVIFYNNCTAAFEESVGVEKLPSSAQDAFRRALSFGERLLQQGLRAVFSEVTTLTLVEAGITLSSPQGLRSLAGKTIIIVNPDTDGLRRFLSAYSRPENEATEVQFYRASLDTGLKLFLESIAQPKSDGDNG